jgi:uncharacterized protein (DUF1499 family)
MARRRMPEDPVSRLAIWARRLGLFALAVALLAVLLLQAGFIEPAPGLVTFGGAMVIAAFGALLALAAFVVIWNHGLRGFGQAMLAIAIAVALTAYPAYLAARAYGLPVLADITTDPADAPRFEAIARLRPRNANPAAYPGASAAALQQKGYPDIEPLQLTAAPQEVYDSIMGIVTKRKWLVIDARSPQGGRRDGHIEAVARTPIMGLRDDVVVRLRRSGEGTRVDIRSAARYGTYDFGANARRVRALLEDIDEAAGSQAAARR